jgi:hypothetical protein
MQQFSEILMKIKKCYRNAIYEEWCKGDGAEKKSQKNSKSEFMKWNQT